MAGVVRVALGFILALTVGAAFAWAVSRVDPYPGTYDLPIFVVSYCAFLLVLALVRPRVRIRWYLFGAATFLCWLTAFLWFWFGAERHGWWYPPHLHILKHFTLVDGESALDAEVADVFLLLWGAVCVVFGVRPLSRGWRRP